MDALWHLYHGEKETDSCLLLLLPALMVFTWTDIISLFRVIKLLLQHSLRPSVVTSFFFLIWSGEKTITLMELA